jgi:hypothetical protein
MDLTDDERDLILAGLFELTITHVEDDESDDGAKLSPGSSEAIRKQCSSGRSSGAATVSRLWEIHPGSAMAGVVSVLFTCDRRVFLMHADGTFRGALDWERDEVLAQMLVSRDHFSVELDQLPDDS